MVVVLDNNIADDSVVWKIGRWSKFGVFRAFYISWGMMPNFITCGPLTRISQKVEDPDLGWWLIRFRQVAGLSGIDWDALVLPRDSPSRA